MIHLSALHMESQVETNCGIHYNRVCSFAYCTFWQMYYMYILHLCKRQTYNEKQSIVMKNVAHQFKNRLKNGQVIQVLNSL